MLFVGVFRDVSLSPDIHSTHASEIPLVFGVVTGLQCQHKLDDPAFYYPRRAQAPALQQCAWVAFAQDPAKGLLEFGWLLYYPNPMPNASTLVELGGFYNLTRGARTVVGLFVWFAGCTGNYDEVVGLQGLLSNSSHRRSSLWQSDAHTTRVLSRCCCVGFDSSNVDVTKYWCFDIVLLPFLDAVCRETSRLQVSLDLNWTGYAGIRIFDKSCGPASPRVPMLSQTYRALGYANET